MNCNRFSWIKCACLLGLAGLFLYSTSIQEVHYLFITHTYELNDHCNNHLHARANHSDCSLCKIDLSFYVQTFSQFDLPKQVFVAEGRTYNLSEAIIGNQFANISLRGPPVSV